MTLAGVSIGASISLIIAARHSPRIVRIIPINPYDYDAGRGLARASVLGRVVMWLTPIPIVGETFMRLRNHFIIDSVLLGGVSDRGSISPSLLREMYLVGNRPGHYRGFVHLLRNASSSERSRSEYGNIDMPTLMIWGAEDWARRHERWVDESLVPGDVASVEGGTSCRSMLRTTSFATSDRRFDGGCEGGGRVPPFVGAPEPVAPRARGCVDHARAEAGLAHRGKRPAGRAVRLSPGQPCGES